MRNTDEMIPAIVAAAIAAAGPKGSNDAAWKAKINDAIPHVVSMLGEQSRQSRIAREVLEADVFDAVYVSHQIEESSTRVLVQLETRPSKKYPDGIEPIRSHRTDNAQGRTMLARLERLEPGTRILVWKAMETSAHDDTMKVRVLVHFEVLPARRTDQSQHSGDSASPSSPAPPARAATRAGGTSDPLADRFNDLPAKTKAAVARRLRDETISFPSPDPEHADRFIIIINEEEQRHV